MLSKQTALKRSDNEQGWPWTALKPLAFTCGFQNGVAGFKMVQPTLKLSDSFEVGQVSNYRSITYISVIKNDVIFNRQLCWKEIFARQFRKEEANYTQALQSDKWHCEHH